MPCRVYSRVELLNRVRGYELASERVVDSHVKNLRRKIEADPHDLEINDSVVNVVGTPSISVLDRQENGRDVWKPLPVVMISESAGWQ